MTEFIEKHPVKIILLVCALIFIANLDVIYVNIMEARNFVTAREMIQNHNWVLTTMNDYPRYEKPPLPTWLTALSAMVFGVHNLFALRLPAALSAIVLVFFFYKTVLLISSNKKLSFYTALILPTSFYIIFSGRNGQWDIFTHSFMVISIYFLIKMLKFDQLKWGNALLSGLFFGCSFLSKGPVSLYALWLSFLIAYGIVYRNELKRKHILPFVSLLLLGFAIGASWFVYVRYADPQSFMEIATEEAGNWTSYNVRPFYYYWSFFTQSGIWTLPAFVALLYPYLKNRVSNKRHYTFVFMWTMASVVLLSFIPEKKSRYLLPVLIPMAFNTAFYIEYLVNHFNNIKKGERFPVYFNFGVIALIGIAFPIGGFIFLKDKLSGHYPSFILTAILLFAIGAGIVFFLRKKDTEKVFYLTIGFVIAILLVGFPLANTFNTNEEFNNINTLETSLPLYSLGEPAPEMIWHLGHSAPEIQHGGHLNIPTEEEFGILVADDKKDELKRIFEKDYSIDYKEKYDINYTANPKDRAYKARLTSSYYIIKKK
ncbi:ArnT family glycosyltransferase [Galbibacter pacificus]|uniref:Glycosyltransferase family 39 protein n=1 Tax=Galbibacter pacificus TaxID=2996052 RepID=A0ABT6FUG1_9FLAO|nr:glycosyltransferase family 39 protein [Galbibacter pacificus]MDG3583621.1 glycosyltransferase family 39 protein [Galbibacter pacificus]MDG3586903.1 glycosyltransferase family 39 protein [Galbibacter pacificus]